MDKNKDGNVTKEEMLETLPKVFIGRKLEELPKWYDI